MITSEFSIRNFTKKQAKEKNSTIPSVLLYWYCLLPVTHLRLIMTELADCEALQVNSSEEQKTDKQKLLMTLKRMPSILSNLTWRM